jgi:hypothetical protein
MTAADLGPIASLVIVAAAVVVVAMVISIRRSHR